MAAKRLWASDSAAAWREVQQNSASTWKENASDKLQDLNRWVESELPGAIASRAPHQHITAAELVKLVDWKLTYGKWRPKLLDYAKAATDEEVRDASAKAISLLTGSSSSKKPAAAAAKPTGKRKAPSTGPESSQKRPKAEANAPLAAADAHSTEQTPAAAAAAAAAAVKEALAALTVLKGVGPATASAVLAAVDSSCPYMGDEALEAACGGRDYTPKAYLQLVEALRAKAAWLQEQDPEAGWSAVLVERCLYAAALQDKGAKGAKGGKAAAAASTKAAGPAQKQKQKPSPRAK